MSEKWVCRTWDQDHDRFPRPHVFDEVTSDGWCPEDPPYHGILLLKQWPPKGGDDPEVTITYPSVTEKLVKGTKITITANATVMKGTINRVEFYVDDNKIGEDSALPYTYDYTLVNEGRCVIKVTAWASTGLSATETVTIKVNPGNRFPEVGLCVMMMDASASMLDTAFEGSPLTKMRLAAASAAGGIFDLMRMHNNPNAFVSLYKFDDRVEHMVTDTISNLIDQYKNVKAFGNYIYDELFEMQQQTDINQALAVAHSFVDKFMKNQLPGFPLKEYTPMSHRLPIGKSTDGKIISAAIPNVRVFIYTDGMQYDSNQNKRLYDNPFQADPIEGLNHDIVIGAFFGQENDDGCQELKSLLSYCPIHTTTKQFFLFDGPEKIDYLKNLFRMASGASGFCPLCLDKTLSPPQ